MAEIHEKPLTPNEIEAESMRLIDVEAGQHRFRADQWQLVKRMIHATADFDFMQSIRFHEQAISAGVQALRNGCSIYCDTAMLASAIQKRTLRRWGCKTICFIEDADVRQESERTGLTRSALAVRKAADSLEGAIIAIGNAPTALNAAIDLCRQGPVTPSLIVGVPVGFVGALQAKRRLCESGLTYITNLDRKGGTPAAAAAINALVKLADKFVP
jgi:precorrin-8X/cobalt-precorrin-8 methylmutase